MRYDAFPEATCAFLLRPHIELRKKSWSRGIFSKRFGGGSLAEGSFRAWARFGIGKAVPLADQPPRFHAEAPP